MYVPDDCPVPAYTNTHTVQDGDMMRVSMHTTLPPLQHDRGIQYLTQLDCRTKLTFVIATATTF